MLIGGISEVMDVCSGRLVGQIDFQLPTRRHAAYVRP